MKLFENTENGQNKKVGAIEIKSLLNSSMPVGLVDGWRRKS